MHCAVCSFRARAIISKNLGVDLALRLCPLTTCVFISSERGQSGQPPSLLSQTNTVLSVCLSDSRLMVWSCFCLTFFVALPYSYTFRVCPTIVIKSFSFLPSTPTYDPHSSDHQAEFCLPLYRHTHHSFFGQGRVQHRLGRLSAHPSVCLLFVRKETVSLSPQSCLSPKPCRVPSPVPAKRRICLIPLCATVCV